MPFVAKVSLDGGLDGEKEVFGQARGVGLGGQAEGSCDVGSEVEGSRGGAC